MNTDKNDVIELRNAIESMERLSPTMQDTLKSVITFLRNSANAIESHLNENSKEVRVNNLSQSMSTNFK